MLRILCRLCFLGYTFATSAAPVVLLHGQFYLCVTTRSFHCTLRRKILTLYTHLPRPLCEMAANNGGKKKGPSFAGVMATMFLNVLLSVLIQAAIFYGGYVMCDRIPAPVAMDVGTRIAFTLRCQLPMLIVLVCTIGRVAFERGFRRRGANPLSANQSEVQVHINCLTNTLEQFVVASFLMLVATTYLDSPDAMKIIPIFSFTFIVGRIVFIVGYNINYRHRALGISINFGSTGALLGYAVYLMYSKGVLYGLDEAPSGWSMAT